jgi:diacylglycerol kinase family enzyme
MVQAESGLLIIANSRHYALGLNLAARATMDDGKLDAAFFPSTTMFGAMKWYASSMMRDHLEDSSARYMQGRTIDVQAGSLPSQVDGEAWHDVTADITLSAVARSIRVLLPAV